MSAAPTLFRRSFSDTLDGEITGLQLAIGECRALSRRHPSLDEVEQTLRVLLDQMQGVHNRAPPRDVDGALAKVRGLIDDAPVGESIELARVAQVLSHIIEQRTAMEACRCTEPRT